MFTRFYAIAVNRIVVALVFLTAAFGVTPARATTLVAEAAHIAKWDTLTANRYALGSNGNGNGSLNQSVFTLGLAGNQLLAGGRFTDVNKNGTVLNTADYIAAYTICTSGPITVQNTNDAGPGSLRQAIADSCPGGVINFDASLSGAPITLASTLVIDKDLTLDGSSLSSNIKLDGAPVLDALLVIGALDNSNPIVTVHSLDFLNGSQAGILQYHGILHVVSGSFSGNGTGILSFGAQSTIIDSDFSNNFTGIYNSEVLQVENSNFANNNRGIYNEKLFDPSSPGEATITNSIFSQNQQGGVHNQNGSLTVINSSFIGNQSDDGGAIKNSGNAVVSGSLFTNNTATQNGGAIANGLTLALTTSTFSGNQAGNHGGAIFNNGGLELTKSTFANNSAIAFGGGLYVGIPGQMSNNTLYGNSAALGGGVYFDVLSNLIVSTMSNNTVANSSGGGLYMQHGKVALYNNILANGVSGSDCYADLSAVITSAHNLIENNSSSPNHCGTPTLTDDPVLEALADNGGFTQTMALTASSPAIAAGSDANCPVADQRGVTRPIGSHCDIGAYEYEGGSFAAIGRWTTAFDLSHGWTVSQYARTVGDVNGDGKTDLVGFGQDGVYIALSTGSGFGAISRWTNAFDLSHGWTVKDHVRTVGDVNGDGKADLVGFGQDGVYVALSTGSGFSAISRWTTAFDYSHGWRVEEHVRTVGDANGDGKADLIGFGQDGVYVALSTASGFDAISQWTSAFDLSHGWTVSDYVRTIGDMNGDGKDDLVGFGLDGVYIALSTGSGFGPISKWTSAFDLSHGWTVSDYVRTVGDVNEDGKADLAGFGLDGVYIALSTDRYFAPVRQWTSSFDLSHGWTVRDYVRTVGDVNGDGRVDLVGFGLDGVYVATAK